jgi:hypothetical protein
MEDLASQIIRRQFWTIILLILCLVISNGIWIWYINQFDFSTESVEQTATNNDGSTINQNGLGA